jgi:alkylation response protein AidB-like acyl-CoA dehydrogenase
MNPGYGSEADVLREKIRKVIRDNLPPGWGGIGAIEDRAEADAFVSSWRRVLFQNGLLGVSWPVEYGGAGFTKLEQVVLVEEMARAGVPAMGYSDLFGVKMLGNTLLHWGTETQKRHYLPKILSGEHVWCQGFSEPDAGSDLASLSTRAVLRDGRWVINGQKIWTSRAREADHIFILARTDTTAAKNRGVTFLLVDMDQPEIEVKPIKSMSGESEFNEVFFTGATTSADNVVGAVDGGWSVARTLLSLERGDEAATNPILFRAELDRLLAFSRSSGRNRDPVVRDGLASHYIRCEIMRFLGLRILTSVLNDDQLGAESSISKLYWSEYHRDLTRFALEVLGSEATTVSGRGPLRASRTDDPGAPNTTGSWVGTLYNAVAGTIYAGTSEIQRNILAEAVLGLPREPRA